MARKPYVQQRNRLADADRLFAILGHPLRPHILLACSQGPTAPVDLYRELRGVVGSATLGNVAYHFRALVQAGLIEVDTRVQVRGASKTYYRTTANAASTMNKLATMAADMAGQLATASKAAA